MLQKTNKSNCYMKILSFYLLSNEHLLLWGTDLTPPLSQCLSQAKPTGFPTPHIVVLFMFNGQRWKIILGYNGQLQWIILYIYLYLFIANQKHSHTFIIILQLTVLQSIHEEKARNKSTNMIVFHHIQRCKNENKNKKQKTTQYSMSLIVILTSAKIRHFHCRIYHIP